MKWLRRISLGLIILMVAALVLLFIFISPVVKYLVERYGKEYTGREITMNSLFLNILSGSISIHGLKIMEANDKDVFFTCGYFESSINIKKALKGSYQINKLKLVAPQLSIYQNGNSFNFDDVIKRFLSADTSKKDPAAPPLQYWVRNIEIDSGYINYNNIPINHHAELKKLNFSCPQLSYDDPNGKFHLDVEIGTGGTITTDLAMNMNSLDFNMLLDVSRFNLSYYYAPLRSFMRVNSVQGFLNSKLLLTGNFSEAGAVATSGSLSLDDLSIKDSSNTEFTSLHQLKIRIDSLNVKHNIFNFRSVVLDQPYFKFDLYTNGDNVSRMLIGADSSVPAQPDSAVSTYDYSNAFTLVASYVKDIAANYIVSNYSADSIIIRNGHFIYDDYTLDDPFRYDVSQVNVVSGKINSQNERIVLSANSVINQKGKLVAAFSVSPDFKDMDIGYTISDIRVTDFNPYSKYYVATPFFDGVLTYECSSAIRDSELKSSNKINIENMEAGKKITKTPVYELPVRLAVSLLKDVHGDIHLDVPVEGNLKDPDYKLGKVIWQVVTNILVKAASAPIHLIANMVGGNEEEMKEMEFSYLQNDFTSQQLKTLDVISKVLEAKPEMYVQLVQLTDTMLEEETMALFNAKKKYYFANVIHQQKDSLSQTDLDAIHSISNKDSLFNQYLDAQLNVKNTDLISTQQKCIQLYGAAALDQQQHAMMEKRNSVLLNHLVHEKNIAAGRIKISNNHDSGMSSGLVNPKYLISYAVDE